MKTDINGNRINLQSEYVLQVKARPEHYEGVDGDWSSYDRAYVFNGATLIDTPNPQIPYWRSEFNAIDITEQL